MLPEKINVLGIRISRVEYDDVIEQIISAAKENMPLGVTALAVHGLMEGFLKKEFAGQLNNFDIVTPDGQPVYWAMKLLGARELGERVCGPELTLKICERAASEKLPIFLYGSRQSILENLKDNLLKKYPGLIIAGMSPDRFRDAEPEEDKTDIDLINNSGARIIFVGRGCPRQEKWIYEHKNKIKGVLIAVGAAFDFHAGFLHRPSKIYQNLGLEWSFRLCQEPKRLWKRYLVLNTLFIFNLVLQLLRIKRFES